MKQESKGKKLWHIYKEYFLGSLVYYSLVYGAMFLFVLKALFWGDGDYAVAGFHITAFEDAWETMLLLLCLPMILNLLVRNYYLSEKKTREFLLTLPVKRRDREWFSVIGEGAAFMIPLLVIWGIVMLLLAGETSETKWRSSGVFVTAFLLTVNFYLLQQVLLRIMREKVAAVFLGCLLWQLKYCFRTGDEYSFLVMAIFLLFLIFLIAHPLGEDRKRFWKNNGFAFLKAEEKEETANSRHDGFFGYLQLYRGFYRNCLVGTVLVFVVAVIVTGVGTRKTQEGYRAYTKDMVTLVEYAQSMEYKQNLEEGDIGLKQWYDSLEKAYGPYLKEMRSGQLVVNMGYLEFDRSPFLWSVLEVANVGAPPVEETEFVENKAQYMTNMLYHVDSQVLFMLVVLVLLFQMWKHRGRLREFLAQLPFSRRQWYFYEYGAGVLVTVGVFLLLSMVQVGILALGGYSAGILLPVVLRAVWNALFLYTFLYGLHAFFRNPFAGIFLEMFCMCCYQMGVAGYGICRDFFEMDVWVLALLGMAVFFFGAWQAKRTSLLQVHFVSWLPLRLAIVFFVDYALLQEFWCWDWMGLLGVILFGIVIYILVDLRFVAGKLERMLYSFGIKKRRPSAG